MEYLNLDAITGRTILMFFLAMGCGYFVLKATKHLIFGFFFTLGAVVGVGFLTDVITMDKVRAASTMVKDKANESLDSANDKAKKIGEMGHTTSAGSGSETNEAYKKRMDKKK